MLQLFTIVLLIGLSVSSVPPQTGSGQTSGPSVTAPGDTSAAEPTENQPGNGLAAEPTENQPGN
jgi:hypothetical protein